MRKRDPGETGQAQHGETWWQCNVNHVRQHETDPRDREVHHQTMHQVILCLLQLCVASKRSSETPIPERDKLL